MNGLPKEYLWKSILVPVFLPLVAFLVNAIHYGFCRRFPGTRVWYFELPGVHRIVLVVWLMVLPLAWAFVKYGAGCQAIYDWLFAGYFVYINIWAVIHRVRLLGNHRGQNHRGQTT